MRTANPNLSILTVEAGTNIIGTAIDADILVNFAVANTEVNRRLFVPSAQLVVTGKFRLGKEPNTIGIWISSVIAIVSIPAPASAEIAATAPIATLESPADVESRVPLPTPPASKQTRSKKAAGTRTTKKTKASTVAASS
jgi:hypothetical protein